MSNEDIKIIKEIKRLEGIKTLFMILTIIVGIITVVDYIIPDPVLFIDEAVFTAIVGLFTYITSVIDSKIKNIRNGEKLKLTSADVEGFTNAVGNTTNSIKNSKNNKLK